MVIFAHSSLLHTTMVIHLFLRVALLTVNLQGNVRPNRRARPAASYKGPDQHYIQRQQGRYFSLRLLVVTNLFQENHDKSTGPGDFDLRKIFTAAPGVPPLLPPKPKRQPTRKRKVRNQVTLVTSTSSLTPANEEALEFQRANKRRRLRPLPQEAESDNPVCCGFMRNNCTTNFSPRDLWDTPSLFVSLSAALMYLL